MPPELVLPVETVLAATLVVATALNAAMLGLLVRRRSDAARSTASSDDATDADADERGEELPGAIGAGPRDPSTDERPGHLSVLADAADRQPDPIPMLVTPGVPSVDAPALEPVAGHSPVRQRPRLGDAQRPGRPPLPRPPVILRREPSDALAAGADQPTMAAEVEALAWPGRGTPGRVWAAPPASDPLTGLDSRFAWEARLDEEAERVSRYGRPVAVVVAELVGMHRLGERIGESQAERLLPGIADIFRREARRCDRVGRLGWDRFGVILPETDERQAGHYVERVRAAVDRWLEAGSISLRLSMGVASPAPSTTLESTVRLAEERMELDRARLTRSDAPRV